MNSKVFALLGKAQRAGEFRNIMCEFLMNAVPCVCAGFFFSTCSSFIHLGEYCIQDIL